MRYANDYDAAVVPDPYYGLNEGFNQGLDYCTDACGGLLETLEHKARVIQEEPSGHEGRRLILRTARALKSPLPRASR